MAKTGMETAAELLLPMRICIYEVRIFLTPVSIDYQLAKRVVSHPICVHTLLEWALLSHNTSKHLKIQH